MEPSTLAIRFGISGVWTVDDVMNDSIKVRRTIATSCTHSIGNNGMIGQSTPFVCPMFIYDAVHHSSSSIVWL